jgi:crotonobetainyl-CoA:carnitine CoA-transferase CaiB-like acyl-CoA transferase
MRCRDGWVALVYTPIQFDRVQAMFGDLAVADPSGLALHDRYVHFARAVAPWFAERTRAEVYAAAREHGVPLGPVYSPRELLSDEQYAARDFLASDGLVPGVVFPRSPMTWNGARLVPRPARRIETLAPAGSPA